MQWMIYGATGYTGALVIEEALKRGHQPLIAGRNVEKLETLSAKYNLDYVAFKLDSEATIGEAIADMDVVYHAAGPFVYTSEPMIRACLATNTHYLDITGEINVFEQTFRYDEAARSNGIALISGVGFDVVPSDCLAVYVAQQIPAPTRLEIGIMGLTRASAGTTKSMLEIAPMGWFGRENGALTRLPAQQMTRKVRLPNGSYRAMALPWGDLATAYRSTGIANITTYFVLPHPLLSLAQLIKPFATQVFRSQFVRRLSGRLIDALASGPDEQTRESGRSYLWAKVSNDAGSSAEAWLETLEPYQFTAKVGVLAVERTLEYQPVGALSPAQAFGPDFILEVEETQRMNSLD